MKRFVSVLLFVLMVLSLTGCMSVRVPNVLQSSVEPKPTVISAQAPAVAAVEPPAQIPADEPAEEAPAETPEEAPAEAPAETPEEAPAEAPEEAPAEAPAEAPEEAPAEAAEEAPAEETAEVPFATTVVKAAEKLSEVQSLHMDMQLNVAMVMALMNCHMDLIKEPLLARTDISLSAMGEQVALQLYAVGDGDAATLYVSADGGVTWEKQTSPTMGALPQSPADTLNLFAAMEDAEMAFVGKGEANGQPALVYSGEVDGESLKEVLYSTGIIGALGSALGIEVPEQSLLDLGDAEVSFLFDEATGLPVRYSVDMTEVVANLLSALLGESLGGEGLDMSMDIPAIVLDITLSDFDAVEPIVVPEAAMNAPEA